MGDVEERTPGSTMVGAVRKEVTQPDTTSKFQIVPHHGDQSKGNICNVNINFGIPFIHTEFCIKIDQSQKFCLFSLNWGFD